jgi:hypothetical protein
MPSEFIKVACYGVEVFVARELPRNTAGTRLEEDERLLRAVILKKLTKVVVRRYVTVGLVLSLTNFFVVPKGKDNIRMVYEALQSGLNEAVWALNFGMLNVDSVLNQGSGQVYIHGRQ